MENKFEKAKIITPTKEQIDTIEKNLGVKLDKIEEKKPSFSEKNQEEINRVWVEEEKSKQEGKPEIKTKEEKDEPKLDFKYDSSSEENLQKHTKQVQEIKKQALAKAAEKKKKIIEDFKKRKKIEEKKPLSTSEKNQEEIDKVWVEEEENKQEEKPEIKTKEKSRKKEEPIIELTEVVSLDKVRKNFARVDLETEKWVKENKKLDRKKEDFEGYQKSKEKYLEFLRFVRTAMYEKAIREVEKLGLLEKEADEKIKEKIEEITKETIIREANRLYDQKMDLKLEAKEESEKLEKMKNFAGKIIEKYRRMPLYKKLLISGGLLVSGMAAGAAGGATGAALVTGVVAGRWFQRVLGGAATAVGLEALIKRSQEKKVEKKTLAELADKLQESIKNNDKKLDEKLLELEGSKKGQKRWRYTLAGTMGALVGSGLISKGLNNIVGGIWSGEGTEKITEQAQTEGTEKITEQAQTEGTEKITEQAQTEGTEKIVEQVEATKFIEIVQKGDSIWKMSEDQLEKHYGEKFTVLDEARKTYLIDAVKDKISENPKTFGLENIDKLNVGQKIDFSSIFEDESEIKKVFDKAGALKQASLENIKTHGESIQKWVEAHPEEQLDSEQVDEILSGKTEITPDVDITDVEMDKQAVLETEITKLESNLVNNLGFNPEEYEVIMNTKISKLFEEIPSKSEAWEFWRSNKTIDLPHHGMYGVTEFNRHIKLAEFIRNFTPSQEIQQMTVKRFLRMVVKP